MPVLHASHNERSAVHPAGSHRLINLLSLDTRSVRAQRDSSSACLRISATGTERSETAKAAERFAARLCSGEKCRKLKARSHASPHPAVCGVWRGRERRPRRAGTRSVAGATDHAKARSLSAHRGGSAKRRREIRECDVAGTRRSTLAPIQSYGVRSAIATSRAHDVPGARSALSARRVSAEQFPAGQRA